MIKQFIDSFCCDSVAECKLSASKRADIKLNFISELYLPLICYFSIEASK